MMGPKEKPTFPPTEKKDIPVAALSAGKEMGRLIPFGMKRCHTEPAHNNEAEDQQKIRGICQQGKTDPGSQKPEGKQKCHGLLSETYPKTG